MTTPRGRFPIPFFSSGGSSSRQSPILPIQQGPYIAPPPLRRPLWRKPWLPRQILHPAGDNILKWNKVFFISCLVGLIVDPLFFYVIRVGGLCVETSSSSGSFIATLRSLVDAFYLCDILIKFRTGFMATFDGQEHYVDDRRRIATRYLHGTFFLDLFTMAPMPQILLWLVIPVWQDMSPYDTHRLLAVVVFIQYVTRLRLTVTLNSSLNKSMGEGAVTTTAWGGAAFNMLVLVLSGHFLGAFWYLLSVSRLYSCWSAICYEDSISCGPYFFDCKNANNPDIKKWLNSTAILTHCDATDDKNKVKFGMFGEALTHDVLGEVFLRKYVACLWWGVRNLSSFGHNLETSTYVGEALFSLLICIVGLVLFSQLLGNVQAYLQSRTVKNKEYKMKKKEVEEWMMQRKLPEELQRKILRFLQYKWLATRGVDEECVLKSLPPEIQRQIRHHLCSDLVRDHFHFPINGHEINAICERLVCSLHAKSTCVLEEGDTVHEMHIIKRGELESVTSSSSSGFNSVILKYGDAYGDELMNWAIQSSSNPNLPLSGKTIRTINDAETFSIGAQDLRNLADQFNWSQYTQRRHGKAARGGSI